MFCDVLFAKKFLVWQKQWLVNIIQRKDRFVTGIWKIPNPAGGTMKYRKKPIVEETKDE